MQLSFYQISQEVIIGIFTHMKYFNCLLAQLPQNLKNGSFLPVNSDV